MKRILLDAQAGLRRIALVRDGQLEELAYESTKKETLIGNIYAGRIMAIKKGLRAAFVDIGEERAAYLAFGENTAYKEGSSVAVQVLKDAFAHKGALVTDKLSFAGKFGVLLPQEGGVGISRKIVDKEERERIRDAVFKVLPQGYGIIMRTDAVGKSGDEIEKEVARLCTRAQSVLQMAQFAKPPALLFCDADMVSYIMKEWMTTDVDALIVNSRHDYEALIHAAAAYEGLQEKIELYEDSIPLFQAYFVESQAQKALQERVWLKSGGYLIIQQTEACVVIDVNTGKFTGARDVAATFFKTNVEAAKEIAHQLKLRNLSGIIIVDFIDMKSPEDKQRLIKALEAAVATDRKKTVVVGMTELGLVQITRRKSSRSLQNVTSTKCRCCEGTGLVRTPEYIGAQMRRKVIGLAVGGYQKPILVQADERLLRAFAGDDQSFIQSVKELYATDVHIQPDGSMEYGHYQIEEKR